MDQKIEIPLSEKMKAISGFFGIRLTEEPEYKVLKQEDDFEVREYGKLLLATTLTRSTYETSSKNSFMRLASYLFGGNRTHKNMTMTSPVFIENKLDGWMMTFVLSKNLDFQSLPTPDDNLVILSTEPSKKFAVMKYSATPNESLMNEMAAKLKSSIAMKQQYRVVSEPRWAQYDGPKVIPFLRRNEVQIQIESIQ